MFQSNILCPACKSPKISFIECSGIYTIYRCQACTIEFCEPMKSMSAQEYEKSEGYNKLRQLGSDSQESVLWWGHKQFFKDVTKLLSNVHAVKLLDIGCGTGAFVDSAIKKGYDAYGVDFDHASIQVAWKTERLKERVFNEDIQKILKRFGRSSLGIITFFEVLEHVEDIQLFMSQIRELLAPNGIIALCVPQADRWSLKFQEREPADYPPNHLTRWTGKALKMFIKATGFDILKFRESPISFGFYRFFSKNFNKKAPVANSVAVAAPTFTENSVVNNFFNFAMRAKQTMLAPIFSALGLRGDRILLIAGKLERNA